METVFCKLFNKGYRVLCDILSWLLYPDHTSQGLEHRHAPYVFWTVVPVKLWSLLLTNTLVFCSHTCLGILKFLQGSKNPGHGTIFVTRPSYVHFPRLTQNLSSYIRNEQPKNEPRTHQGSLVSFIGIL